MNHGVARTASACSAKFRKVALGAKVHARIQAAMCMHLHAYTQVAARTALRSGTGTALVLSIERINACAPRASQCGVHVHVSELRGPQVQLQRG